MHIPIHWARARDERFCALGWSDTGVEDARRHARERLAKAHARAEGEWDYYPDRPVKEEILESPDIPGIRVVITRNRAGAEVLNTDRVAFIDIDLEKPSAPGCLGSLFRGPVKARAPVDEPLERARTWAMSNGALLRAYRTAAGLRLIRLDLLMNPAGDDTRRMFEALGTDPQYQRLCAVQESFRARLTPKPYRIGIRGGAPPSHPRTDPPEQRAFAKWLGEYESKSPGYAVCEEAGEIGSGSPAAPARLLAEWHDRRTLRAGAPLA